MDADYVVIRPGPGLPEGFLPPELIGRWFDRSTFPVIKDGSYPADGAVAVPTGRFEVREHDGAVAEIYEFQL